MYSGNVSHVHGTPACSTSMGIASTYESIPASFSRAWALTGARASEQLPMMTLVAPWWQENVHRGSQSDLGVVVTVIVHEAGRDYPPISFDDPPGRAHPSARAPRSSRGHADVTVESGPA